MIVLTLFPLGKAWLYVPTRLVAVALSSSDFWLMSLEAISTVLMIQYIGIWMIKWQKDAASYQRKHYFDVTLLSPS